MEGTFFRFKISGALPLFVALKEMVIGLMN